MNFRLPPLSLAYSARVRQRFICRASIALLAAAIPQISQADSGIWIGTDGLWSNAANWSGGLVADGIGFTADFGAVDLTADAIVHLDSARTIGNLTFGDTVPGTAGNWLLDNNANALDVLTLSSAGVPVITVNTLGTSAVATISAELAGSQGFTKSGAGTLVLSGINTITGAISINTGVLRVGIGGTISAGAFTTAALAGVQLIVAGGSLTSNAVSTISPTGLGFLISSGSATFNGGIRTSNVDGAIIKVSGGTFNATDVSVQRDVNSSTDFSKGFIISGGTASVGTVGIATNNSSGHLSIEGGSLTASGTVTIGNQATSGRGGFMRVTSGTFISSDPINGVVLSKTNGTNSNNVATATFSGGTSTVEKFTLGFDSTVAAGTATLALNGGTLYIGSGGIVKNGAAGLATAVNFTAGLLGAKNDWSSSVPISTGTGASNNVLIKAADAADVAHDISLSGVLSGSSGFTKTGAGRLILSGVNTYTGGTLGTTISAGTLQVGDGGASGTLGTSVVVNNATLAFNRSDAYSLANAITGPGSLRQNGSGTLTLAGIKDYTGATIVTAGRLNVDGTLTGSSVSVNTGGTLGGIGTIAGNVVVDAGGKLAPGSAGSGTLTLGGITLSSGSTLDFDFGSLNTYDKVVVSNLDGLLFNGAGIHLYAENTTTSWTTPSTYSLFQYSGVVGGLGLSGLSVLNKEPGFKYNFGAAGGLITLTISSDTVVPVWNRPAGGTWTAAGNWTATVPNFKGATASFSTSIATPAIVTLDGNKTVGVLQFGSPIAYTIAQGSSGTLLLDATAGGAKIDVLSGSHLISAPVSLTANTTATVFDANDTLRISGTVGGIGSLSKSGAGTLLLAAANTYSGSTLLNAGIVEIANSQSLGSAAVTFIANSTLRVGVGGLSPLNNFVIGNGAAATIEAVTGTTTLSGIISDSNANGSLAKTGLGKLALSALNTYSGVTTINAGVLSVTSLPNGGVPGPIGQSTSAASSLVLDGGTLEYAGVDAATDRALTLGIAGGTLSSAGSGAIVFASADPIGLIGTDAARTLTLSGSNIGANTFAALIRNNGAGATSLLKSGPGNWILSNANTFTGTTSISAGTLTLGNPLALSFSTLNYDNQGGSLNFGPSSSASLGAMQGAQPLALVNGNASGVALTLGGNNQSTTYSGALTGSGSLVKSGTGTQTFSGPNSYTGSSLVSGGTLRIDIGGSIDGTSNLNVNTASTLLLSGGTLNVAGATTLGTSATTTANRGTVTIDSGTAVFRSVVIASSDNSKFQINGGTVNLGDFSINRDTSSATANFGNAGLVVSGGTTIASSLNIGNGNSWGTMLVNGGKLTNTGAFTVGNQLTATRGGRLRVTGSGTLVSTDPGGLVLGAKDGNVASAEFSGGTAAFEKISLIADDSIKGASATVTLNGGTLYLGSGGMAANLGGGSTASVVLASGTLGASADWSSAVASVQLTGAVTVQSADSVLAAHAIVLSGAISGSGTLTKTGAGDLTLSGINSYSGPTIVNEGSLHAGTGSLGGTLSVSLFGGSVRLDGADAINDLAFVNLSGGLFSTAGFSDRTGALGVLAPSTLDLGAGASLFHFADSHLNIWNGSLSILHWSGSALGGGTDQLFFGTDTSGLTADQLALIRFVDPAGMAPGSYSARSLANGELVVVPEPASWSALLGGGALLLGLRRRRPAR